MSNIIQFRGNTSVFYDEETGSYGYGRRKESENYQIVFCNTAKELGEEMKLSEENFNSPFRPVSGLPNPEWFNCDISRFRPACQQELNEVLKALKGQKKVS